MAYDFQAFFEERPLRTQLITVATLGVAIVVALCATIGGIYSFQYAKEARQSYLNNVALTGSANVKERLIVIEQSADEVATTVAAGAISGRSRAQTSERMRLTLVREPDLFGVWFVSEPNGYDRLDARHKGKPPSDASGVFVPYWVRDGSGGVLQDTTGREETAEEDRAQPYYAIPASKRSPHLLEPYLEELEKQTNRSVLMTSYSEPVIVDEQLIGVAGIDVELASIQQMIEALGQQTQTELLVLTESGSIIASTIARATSGSRIKRSHALTELESLLGYFPRTVEATIRAPRSGDEWRVIVIEPAAKTIQIALAISAFVVLGGLAMILATAVAAFFVTPFITKRFEVLSDYLNRLSQGDLGTPEEHLTPPFREGKQISHAVNAMRETLIQKKALSTLLEQERATLEHRILERTAELEHALQVAQRSEVARAAFLSNMSHEIRTPLNGVIGIAEVLKATPLQPKQLEMVNLIASSSVALGRILSDSLDLARLESGNFEVFPSAFNLREAIEAAAGLFRVSAEDKGIRFEIRYSPNTDCRIETDEVRLRQIITNLTANAVKFTERGAITIDVDVTGDAHAALLTVRVTDTGIGFDQDTQARLFSRFEQADASVTRKYGGTGLGLAISQSLATLLGGEISAKSELGCGSNFTLHLPCKRLPEPTVAMPDAERAFNPGHETKEDLPLRILLAEDNPTNQKVVQIILEPFGVDLTIANNGQEALDRISAHNFDIVLMDMQMPVMDGLAATRAIRNLELSRGSRRTPILMLTANTLPEHIEASLAAGCDQHIAKPVTPKTLAEAIFSALNSTDEV